MNETPTLGDQTNHSSKDNFKYWAFISYSHADEEWAKWLHKSIETYRVPRKIVGRETPQRQISKRLFPVFRDREGAAGRFRPRRQASGCAYEIAFVDRHLLAEVRSFKMGE